MKQLVLAWLLLGSVQAGEITEDLNPEGSIHFDFSQQRMIFSPKVAQSEVLTRFVGFCDQDVCFVNENNQFTLSYTVTGANHCYGSDGHGNWQVNHPHSDGDHTIFMLPIQYDTTFTLSCVQASDSSVHSLSVKITTVNGGPHCAEVLFPPGLNRIKGMYKDFNDNQNFGASTNTSFELDIANNQFYTLAGFSLTGDTPFNERRKITLADAPTQRQIDQSTLSISECPGDFSANATCVIPIATALPNSVVRFSTVATDDPNQFCILDPDKTYFANFINSPDPQLIAPSCRFNHHAACTVFYSEGLVVAP